MATLVHQDDCFKTIITILAASWVKICALLTIGIVSQAYLTVAILSLCDELFITIIVILAAHLVKV